MADLLVPFAGKSAPNLAETVRANFGSLGRALAAPKSQIAELGQDLSRICELIEAAQRLLDAARHEHLYSCLVDPASPVIQKYLQSRIGSRKTECLLVIFCDPAGQYMQDDEMGVGTGHNVRADMVALFRHALKINASSFLLAHNHPSGICLPSEEDICATRQLAKNAQILGLSIMDHLIVTKDRCFSMRNMQLC